MTAQTETPEATFRHMEKSIARFLFIVLTALLLLNSAAADAVESIDIGSRRELFVDDHLIEQLTGEIELRLHHPTPREIAIVHDAPWEGTASSSHTVFQDGDLLAIQMTSAF